MKHDPPGRIGADAVVGTLAPPFGGAEPAAAPTGARALCLGDLGAAGPLDLAWSMGLADVLAKRVEQIRRFGYTREADAQRPLHHFARNVQNMATTVYEDSHFGLPLAVQRRHAVKLAAFALALIDRIDAEPEEEDAPL